MHWIATYTKEVAAVAATGAGTEHSYRTAIEKMLQAAAAEFDGGAEILQEPTRTKNIGAPDFRIGARGGGVIGYLECKPPGADLEKLGTAGQIKKYQNLSGNILLTDSWKWILFKDGKKTAEVALTEKPNKEQKTQFTELLRRFIHTEAEKIGDAERLAAVLARRCALLREGLESHAADPAETRLHGLLEAFRTALDTELDFAKFADAFAQTLVYSLLLAKLKAPAGDKIALDTIRRHIPVNFAVIREITTFLQELDDNHYADVRWVVDDILATINAMDAGAVSESMSYRNGGKGFDDADDPYIYFYENFLAAYDARQRERRGVYYTPPPVVKFIVRAVDDLLRRDFGLAAGLAQTDAVTALDFAAGTGTFMLEMFRTVLSGASPARRDILTREHILKNFHGFELLMAPYAIAHLKLSQFLADNGVPLKEDERINIFLTNTLEQISKQIELPFMPKLAEEANRAQEIKDTPVLVITGNPPYSVASQNKGKWITRLVEDYKFLDGEPLNERKQTLSDDYVKFIRFAQWKMEKVERGIVAVITNHGFLENPTFRGMRKNLLDTFDVLYLLDLHGNANRKETTPDGGKDENVFDIRQGVAISLLIKNPEVKKKKCFHADLWGLRKSKYRYFLEYGLDTTQWQELKTSRSPYLFVPRNEKDEIQYQKHYSIADIFTVWGTGISSHRDHFAFTFNADEIKERIKAMADANVSTEKLRKIYSLKDTRDWDLTTARKLLMNGYSFDEFLQPCLYRPFDTRWCYYGRETMNWPRPEAMSHMLAGENIGLCISKRQEISGEWQHVFAVNKIVEYHTATAKEVNYLICLYRYDNELGASVRTENLNPDFRRWIDNRYGKAHTPEAILGCIYAILHSPDYRNRYADFLRTDFPRIPFPEDNAEFNCLAAIGQQLIAAHLLRDHCTGPLAKHEGAGATHQVEKVRYDEKTQRLYFNQTEYFAPIPPQVFNFQIGGYKPLDKYLKSRKDRSLNLQETDTIAKAANALAFTIEKMGEIDQ